MAVSYVGYELDVGELEDVLAKIDGTLQLQDNELTEIAQRMALFISDRTGRGVDYKGQPFAPYAQLTKDIREDAGRNTAFVDLLFEGHMFASMRGFAEGGDAVVGFSPNEQQKARWHNEGTRHMPQRRFLDLDRNGPEAATLARMTLFFLRDRLNKL